MKDSRTHSNDSFNYPNNEETGEISFDTFSVKKEKALIFFHSETCTHFKDAKKFLNEFVKGKKIHYFEIEQIEEWDNGSDLSDLFDLSDLDIIFFVYLR